MLIYREPKGTDLMPREERYGAYVWLVCVIMALVALLLNQ